VDEVDKTCSRHDGNEKSIPVEFQLKRTVQIYNMEYLERR
jgi:hypothetical protein